MQNDPIVIVGAARTPMGGFQGDFASLAASDLGGVAIKAAVERAGVRPDDVEELIFGNCSWPDRARRPRGRHRSRPVCRLSTNCTTRQQDVRLGDEGRDARARR